MAVNQNRYSTNHRLISKNI